MKYYLLLALAFIAQINSCFSQWMQCDGPYGETRVNAIIPNDSIVLSSTNCGSFTKKSIGSVWNLNSLESFSAYTKIGDSLYISSNGLKRIDLAHPNLTPATLNFISLQALAHSDSCLYGAYTYGGFSKSSNFGLSWTYHNLGLPADTGGMPNPPYYYLYYRINAVETTSNFIFCGTAKGVYKNSGALSTWIACNSGLPVAANVTLLKAVEDTLFAAIGNELYRSVDFGNNWTLFFTSASSINSMLKVNQQYYVGSAANGISYSVNNGSTWTLINAGLTDLNISTLAVCDSTLLCGTNSQGVFVYQNGQWISNRSGMVCSAISSIVTTNSGIAANDRRRVYLSTNGNSWKAANTPAIPFYPNLSSGIGSMASEGDTIFISYNYTTPNWPFFYSFINYTIDTCATWNNLINNVPYIGDDPYGISLLNNRLFAYEDDKMFYTDNLGLSYTNISLPAQYCNMFNCFTIFKSIPFAGACGNGQVLKLDSTQNWVLANNGLPTDREPRALLSCDSALFAFIDYRGMYVSFDIGNNWTLATNGLQSITSIRGYASKGAALFVTTENGVYVTSDYGQNWVSINDGLKNNNTSSIKIINDTLYLGTFGNGIWKQSLADINIGVQNFLKSKNALKLYPNPASNAVHVATNCINAEYKIIDILGKQVATGSLNSSNEINVSALQMGAYTLFLQQGNKKQSAKLLIAGK